MDHPDRPDVAYSNAELNDIWNHPRHDVAVGERVLYRHDQFGDVTDALVVQVEPIDPDDPHSTLEWPTVLLLTDHGYVRTRQSLIRGGPGWLPLSWLETA